MGANLDRIQIIKGWLDAKGDMQEKVYDVVWSDGRKPGADGKLPPVGNTVDVANAVWTNTIGAPELITVWKDLDFDPALRAFYYVRVIEIPTPRWTAYDAKYYGVTMRSGSPHDHPGTRLHLAHLVHAGPAVNEAELAMKLLREPWVHFLMLGDSCRRLCPARPPTKVRADRARFCSDLTLRHMLANCPMSSGRFPWAAHDNGRWPPVSKLTLCVTT